MTSSVVETHTATLLFLDDLVCKRKKPLDLGFLDFRTVAARRQACEEETRLNRRLAPDVYLGVAEVRDPSGIPCDYLVLMRRLPAECSLAQLVADGVEVRSALGVVARQIADLHQRSPAPPELVEVASGGAWHRAWDVGLDALAPYPELVAAQVREQTRGLAHAWLDRHGALLARRVEQGRVVDGHGDLLADDVFVLDDGPRVLDCLEFDPRLRVGDGAADVAFLAMDLERLGAADLGRVVLDSYADAIGDVAPRTLLHFYLAYRAHIRSKVSCIRARQEPSPHVHAQARDLSDLALRHLVASRPQLVLIGGLPGSGKSTVAQELARRTGATVLSSDVVRKRLLGLPLDERAAHALDEGPYDADTTARTYRALLDDTRPLLEQGCDVVLDATFGDPAWRAAARETAEISDAAVREVCCTVTDAVADARLRARVDGASDATPQVRAALRRRAAAWPEATVLDTSQSVQQCVAQLRD